MIMKRLIVNFVLAYSNKETRHLAHLLLLEELVLLDQDEKENVLNVSLDFVEKFDAAWRWRRCKVVLSFLTEVIQS